MGLDGKKAGQEQFTDVFCSLDAEYFDLRERNSAFGKQNGTTKHPETSNRIFTFTVQYELDPGNERKNPLFALPPPRVMRWSTKTTKLHGVRIHRFRVFSWKGTNVRFQ